LVGKNPLARWIIKPLTRHEYHRGVKANRLVRIEIPPSQRLVYGVQFCFIALGTLAMIEIVHIIVLHSFDEAIFSAISGLIGTILGVFLT
jgi:hypothetical protein